MKTILLNLLLVMLLAPGGILYSQDDYMLNSVKPLLGQSDQKRIEKAEKFLVSANGMIKEAKEIESSGRNKNKALNKKLSASNDYGSAHKIIYEVYLDNVQINLSASGPENAKSIKKSIDNAAKHMKEAKKKREASLRNTVSEKSYELAVQAEEMEKNAISGLARSYLLIKNPDKNISNEKDVSNEQIINNQVDNAKKEVDNPKKQPASQTKSKMNDEGIKENSKTNYNENVKDGGNEIKILDKQEAISNDFVEHDKNGVYFKIQIAASKSPLTVGQLNAIYKTSEMFNVDKEGEWYKYYVSQKFTSYDEATVYKNNLKIKGIFIVAFKDGKKISIEEALKKDEPKKEITVVMKTEPTEIKSQQQGNKIVYRLQIGISTKPMSATEVAGFKNGGNPVLTFDHGGWYSYNIGDFNTEQEALSFKKAKGLNDAFVVKFVNGVLVEE